MAAMMYEAHRSGALKVRLFALVKSRRGHVLSLTGTRSGKLIVYMIGRRISGQPSCDEGEMADT